MSEMINNIGNRLVTKARCVNHVLEEWYSGKMSSPLRCNPHYSEFRGMLELVKTMGIDYAVIYSDDTTTMTAIEIQGKMFEI